MKQIGGGVSEPLQSCFYSYALNLNINLITALTYGSTNQHINASDIICAKETIDSKKYRSNELLNRFDFAST